MAKHRRVLPPLPFEHFFSYAEMEAILRGLAAARPEWARLHSLGRSREGRELYCLTVTDATTGPAEDKPAYLIHGNIHAGELSGTHAALYTARQLLADYPHKNKILAHVAFHIVPRINPDGAEVVVTTSEGVRSRTDRSILEPNQVVPKDMNGDGLILQMRQEHPDGDRVPHPKDKRLLVRRRAHSQGPFYRVFPEGEIHDWDGSDNIRPAGRGIDWNRQWGYDWRPEPEQGGAGDFPYSEPEMRAMAEFITAHPNLFGILGYHTGPAALLRPPSAGSDADLDPADLRKMKDICLVGTRLTGLEATPVTKYAGARRPDLALRGHFPSTGYFHFGLFVFEFELGTMWDSAGIKWKEVTAIEDEEEYEDIWRRMLAWCDRRGLTSRVFVPWKPFQHPQLGRVEIGGLVFREWAGMAMRHLRQRCEGTYRFTLYHASLHPRVRLEDVRAEAVSRDIYRIRARVANRGELPTNISNRGAKLRRLQTVRVEFRLGQGVKLLSNQAHYDLGHLSGPGGSRALEWFVRGAPGAKCRINVHGGTGGNTGIEVFLPEHSERAR